MLLCTFENAGGRELEWLALVSRLNALVMVRWCWVPTSPPPSPPRNMRIAGEGVNSKRNVLGMRIYALVCMCERVELVGTVGCKRGVRIWGISVGIRGAMALLGWGVRGM